MTISSFQRFTSNTSEVFLGADREQAAINAANGTGGNPISINHAQVPVWPSIKKFENDDSFKASSPYGNVFNPEYIWDQPIATDGQTAAFAIASRTFELLSDFSIFLVAFADNAMEAKIELFEFIGGVDGTFVKVSPQPSGLDEFLLVAGVPNTPAIGLMETQPYNWQDIRAYSTRFTTPPNPSGDRIFKIVVSFDVTNYLVPNPPQPNPAGLQFMVDIYRNIL